MVAEKVVLTTRKAGLPADQGVVWESEGGGEYQLADTTRDTRGTEIVLTLRKEEKEYLDPQRLKNIVTRYSDHISLPIVMPKEPSDKKSGAIEWETVNKASALWARSKKEISDEEYRSFYTTLSYDPDPPLSILHNRVEGKLEYISLFFIPARAPFDLWNREHRGGVKLYVRRVFIMDDAEHLMPAYLRFVRGIVDSADLPLNVSRELLQRNREIDKIKAASVKKILNELKRMAAKDQEKYQEFWSEFGLVFKEGVVEDPDNRELIASLLRFASTRSDGEQQEVSLDDYVERMPAKQKHIYFLTAESCAAARNSPHLEIFRKHDIEVLLLGDPIDEWVVTHLTEYKDKTLKNIAKGSVDLEELDAAPDAEKKTEHSERYSGLIEKFKQVLADRVKDVRLSDRLTDSPACLVADEQDIGANLERILKSVGQATPAFKPILELNPDHPIVAGLNADAPELEDWALVLFDQAALSEGAQLREPAAYVRRINSLLTGKTGAVDAGIILPT